MRSDKKTVEQYLKTGICKIRGESWKEIKKPKAAPVDYSDFYFWLDKFGIEKPVREYKFHLNRKWRIDFCWPGSKLALEVEGGIWTGGRHTRGSGFIKDMEKYNNLAYYRFYLIRVTPDEMQNGAAAIIVNDFFNDSK